MSFVERSILQCSIFWSVSLLEVCTLCVQLAVQIHLEPPKTELSCTEGQPASLRTALPCTEWVVWQKQQIGPCRLCWHNFENDRYVENRRIILRIIGML